MGCNKSFVSNIWKCPFCGEKPINMHGYIAFAPRLAEQNTMFNSCSFKLLIKFEPTNFWFRARNKLIVWALQKYFPNMKSFFEIGCGTGFVLSGVAKKFPNTQLYASDIYSCALKYAGQRVPRANLLQMDARNIPFANEFDVIGMFDALEHIQEDTVALSEIYKALKPGGGIILTVPQHPFLWSKNDEYGHHCRRYTANDLINKLQKAGFAIIKKTSFVSLLLPIMLLSRLKQKRDKDFDPVVEFKINKLVNFTLEKLLDLERFFIRTKVNLPIGGSLLIIAQKPNNS